MKDCSVKDVCNDRHYANGCQVCAVAKALAEAEKPPATYVTANLTDDQLDKLIRTGGVSVKKSYTLLPNNPYVWMWISVAVILVFMIIRRG